MVVTPLKLSREQKRTFQEQLNRAADEDPGDGSEICRVIGVISRKTGVQQVAGATGLERTSLYRTFNGTTDARLSNVLRVVRALGCRLTLH